jgi:hypothetical protein
VDGEGVATDACRTARAAATIVTALSYSLPRKEGREMAKSQDTKKEKKKAPQKTPKEKKQAKREKKTN